MRELPGMTQRQLAVVDRWARTHLPVGEHQEAILRCVAEYGPGNQVELGYALMVDRYPVDIETFMFDPFYLGRGRDEIYDEVLRELKAINNPGGTRLVNQYTEAVFTGSIGSAKSSTALYTVAYQLYIVSCFRNPHEAFGLERSTEIEFIFQSVNGAVAKEVDYARFYALITPSPYFRTVFPFNAKLKSELHFPHRVIVKAIGSDGGSIGQNVIGGLIDEINFMAITQQSKKTQDRGEYNQALKIYNGIARRRKSRFMSNGSMPGILCLVSSKHYPGEFTDQKVLESKSDPTIYVYDKRVWDVKPGDFARGSWFEIFTGDDTRKAMILTAENEELYEEEKGTAMRMLIPGDFKKEFEQDMIGSLRDIAGVSVLARHPFFNDTASVSSAFGRIPSVLNQQTTDMENPKLAVKFFKSRFQHLERTRWVHVDLGVTSDAAGVACGYVEKFVQTEDGLLMPQINFDFVLRVTPPPNKEIQFFKIRRLIIMLRDAGLPIEFVSFDSFQSVDSIQLLRQAGFSTGRVSMDKDVLAYSTTKTAMYQRRMLIPEADHARKEFASLEQDAKTGKVDHPANFSKDVADAIAGVTYGLTTSRRTWTDHGVAVNQMIDKLKEVRTEYDESQLRTRLEADRLAGREFSTRRLRNPDRPEDQPIRPNKSRPV